MSQVKQWHASVFDAMISIAFHVCDVHVNIPGIMNEITKKLAIINASAARDRSRLLRVKLF